MSTRRSLAALGIGAFVAFVIASFPASVAYRWFAPDVVALASVEGTIWRGSASFGAVESISFADLRWQVNPAALLTGKLGVAAEARLDNGFVRANLTLSRRRFEFDGLTASTELGTFHALLPDMQATGQISINLDRLELVDGWPVAASGEVRVADLASPPLLPMPGVTLIPLGNYVARLATRLPDGIEAVVTDQGGPLELEGRASLVPGGNYRLEAGIIPRATASSALVEGLSFISQPDSEGRYPLELAGRLAL